MHKRLTRFDPATNCRWTRRQDAAEPKTLSRLTEPPNDEAGVQTISRTCRKPFELITNWANDRWFSEGLSLSREPRNMERVEGQSLTIHTKRKEWTIWVKFLVNEGWWAGNKNSTTIRSIASLENLKSLDRSDRSKTWDFREKPYYLYSQLQPINPLWYWEGGLIARSLIK